MKHRNTLFFYFLHFYFHFQKSQPKSSLLQWKSQFSLDKSILCELLVFNANLRLFGTFFIDQRNIRNVRQVCLIWTNEVTLQIKLSWIRMDISFLRDLSWLL